jgi:hypothetical protein
VGGGFKSRSGDWAVPTKYSSQSVLQWNLKLGHDHFVPLFFFHSVPQHSLYRVFRKDLYNATNVTMFTSIVNVGQFVRLYA